MTPVKIQGWRKYSLGLIFAAIISFVPLTETNGDVMKVLIVAALGSNALVGSMRSLGETISRNINRDTGKSGDSAGA